MIEGAGAIAKAGPPRVSWRSGTKINRDELSRRKRTAYPTNSEESSLQAAGNLPF